MDPLLGEFVAETGEALAQLDADLTRLERRPSDPAPLERMLRVLHSVKGGAGFLGLARLGALAHAGEGLLAGLRDGGLAITGERAGLILESLDRMRALVAALERAGAEPAGDDAPLLAALEAACREDGDAEAEPAAAATGGAVPAEPPPGPPAGTVRVGVDLLDRLAARADELRRIRALLSARAGEAAAGEALARLDRAVSALEADVRRARRQPVARAWAWLPRLVRELERALGKDIDFALEGGATELDRRVLERLNGAVVHLVRNAADHGLEAPGERRAAGKPAAGRLVVAARPQGERAAVEVRDDGRGIAREALRERARERALAGAAELAGMDDRALARLAFRAGLSTAPSVTAVSGRGIGMDAVRTAVEALGGTVELDSTPGTGTRVRLTVPRALPPAPAAPAAAAETAPTARRAG